MFTDMPDGICRQQYCHMRINLLFILRVKINGALTAISLKCVRGDPVTCATINTSVVDEKEESQLLESFLLIKTSKANTKGLVNLDIEQ